MPDQTQSNVHQLRAFDPDEMMSEIVSLRERVVSAWRERAVMLTRDEQVRLLAEIRETCRLLNDLAH